MYQPIHPFLSSFKPVISPEGAHELQVHHSFILVFFFGGLDSSLRCRSYHFLSLTCFPILEILIQVSLVYSPLSILRRSAEIILEDPSFLFKSVQAISRLLPHSSLSNQHVQYLSSNHYNGVLFEWAHNPQVLS